MCRVGVFIICTHIWFQNSWRVRSLPMVNWDKCPPREMHRPIWISSTLSEAGSMVSRIYYGLANAVNADVTSPTTRVGIFAVKLKPQLGHFTRVKWVKPLAERTTSP